MWRTLAVSCVSCCDTLVFTSKSTDRRACTSGVGRGVRLVVYGVCWLVVRSPPSLSSLPDPFSLDCLSRACQQASRSFPSSWAFYSGVSGLLLDSNFAVVSSVTSVGLSVLSPGSLQQRPHVSVSAGPFGAALNHNPTRTAIIFICVDSFIQLLTAKHQMLIPSLVQRSHADDTTHSSGHSLSSPVTGWLLQREWLSNPGGLRWSPHLLPISRTQHTSFELL